MKDRSSEPLLPDFTTGEGLRALLEQLTAEQLWRTHPAARALMQYAQEKYLPLARSWHRDPADAAYEAFMAMRTPAIRRAADPWAAITRAVELGMAAEVHAERLLTSTDKARRPDQRPDEYPMRAGHYETFFYHVLAAASPPASPTVAVERVVRSASVFLVSTGWHPRTIETAVEYICHRLTTLASTQSGIDVLRKDWAVSSFVDDLFVDFRPRLRSGRSRRPGSRRGCGSRGWSAAGGGCRTPLCTASRRISLAAGSRRTAGSTSRS